MPEHTPDPIRELENFGSGGTVMTPLPPAEVRRRGDRRRARRRTAAVVSVAMAAVVAVVLPVVLTHGGDADGSGHVATQAPTPTQGTTQGPTQAPQTTAPASEPTETTYPGQGVVVKTQADLTKLDGTTAEFKAFIGTVLVSDRAGCANPEVDVMKYSPAGYAIGGVGGCGGHQALWVLYEDSWAEGYGTQDTWDCDTLAFLHVPQSFTGGCAEEAGTFGTTGTGMPEPGMTRAEAKATGLTITTDAKAPPCVSTEYAAPVVPADHTEGTFSPHDGLVQVAMTTNMKTEDKVGLGTPRSTVEAAYPGGQDNGNIWIVPRPGGTSFLIRFGADDRVSAFTWALDRADCADYLK